MWIRTAWVASALSLCFAALPACKSAARVQHDKLAPVLAAPVRNLCDAFANLESGGCQWDCTTRVAAQRGHAAWRASRALAVVARFDDPATEALLVPGRERSREILSGLGDVCSATVADDAEITPGIKRCAESEERARATISALRVALDALARSVKERVGADLPSTATSCRN